MKIAIMTSGILPVPAVQGGAVENLIDFYMQYNEKYRLHDITVYSVYNRKVASHHVLRSEVNHYFYIDANSLWAKIKRSIFLHTTYDRAGTYNNHYIEYYFEKVLKHIRKANYDIIIMENRPSFAIKLRKHTKAKLICHLHNELLNINTRGAIEIYNSLDRIITVSNYITNSVKTINPKDKKCITVYNGINLQAFRMNRISIIKREDIGLIPEDFVLVFSGRMNLEKGILELIKAMNIIKDKKNIKLLVIGGSFFGNDIQDNNFITDLKTIASPIHEQIIFTGFVPYERIPDYLKISDVAVIPSIWNDPFPTTVLEAQAMGLPIIATRNGGIPEEVSNNNAILLETNDHFIESLAEAIIWIYEHSEERGKMGESSLINSTKFNKERFAKDFFKAL